MTSYRINNLLDPSSTQDAATKSYVDTSIPIGGIIMWSGTTGTSLPSNWKLCDGSTYNSIKTPDLRGRFVLSSGSGSGLTGRTVDNTGGAETVKLTEAQMPQHKHGVGATTTTTDGTHTHGITDPNSGQGHQHSLSDKSAPGGSNDGAPPPGYWGGSYKYGSVLPVSSLFATTGITVDSTNSGHGHAITVTESDKGSNAAHENMPPFYVIAFIMRIS